MTPSQASPYAPIPGPADRVTFFAMQRRHRRAVWRFSAVAVIAIILTGLPLSIVITPLLYAVALIVGAILRAVDPTLIPASWWAALHNLPQLFPHVMAYLAGKTQQVPPLREILVVSGMLVTPGAVLLLGFWLMVRLVFRRAGVGGVLLTIGARDPNLNDFEERQLMNLTEEMAIAAGVPPPRVMLLDTPGSNAAAVGWSIKDATIVVTRPMLGGLQRDETQAVIGQLIGSIGNGDLKIALIVLSVFQAVGLVSLLLNALFGWRAWVTLFRFARLAILPHGASEQDAVMTALARAADDDDDVSKFMDKQSRRGCLGVLFLPLIPIQWSAMSIDMIVGMSTTILTGPVIAAMWKRRKLLADATAVQLTRNPDGLAGALQRLDTMDVAVPRADGVSHLFEVAWSGRQRDKSSVGSLTRHMRLNSDRRLKQLRAMGAKVNLGMRKPSFLGGLLAVVLLGPLLVIAVACIAMALGLIMMLDLVFMAILLAAIAGIANVLTTHGPQIGHAIVQLAHQLIGKISH